MSLRGLRVLEIAGLAPAPFCGMILADHGASVVRVDRTSPTNIDSLARGKKSVALDFKQKSGIDAFKRLVEKADVVIEPFRPGVMEKLGLGPSDLMTINKKLVYARLSGYGQTGPWAREAGHDINYISISGMLDVVGRSGEKPLFASNLLGDFAGGSFLCAIGILMALVERSRSGVGQVVDAAMSEGAAYLGSFVFANASALYSNARGQNLLDSGAPFYDTYRTKDGRYMAVGSIEPQFYANLLRVLEISDAPFDQMDSDQWPAMRRLFEQRFASRTRDEWTALFDGQEACVTPVLSLGECAAQVQNAARGVIGKTPTGELGVAAAPRLSRTPGASVVDVASKTAPVVGQHTIEVLRECMSAAEISALLSSGAALAADGAKL